MEFTSRFFDAFCILHAFQRLTENVLSNIISGKSETFQWIQKWFFTNNSTTIKDNYHHTLPEGVFNSSFIINTKKTKDPTSLNQVLKIDMLIGRQVKAII